MRRLLERQWMIRLLALVLALAAALPWLTSRGAVDEDRYVGNPFPLVDWLLSASALAAAIRPRLVGLAALVGGVSVSLALLALSVDRAEGLDSSAEYGLVLAAVVSALLWVAWHKPASRMPPSSLPTKPRPKGHPE